MSEVSTKHPEYIKYLRRWGRVDDVYDGEDRIRAQGERYLPMTGAQKSAYLAGQQASAKAAYDAYAMRAELPDIFQPSIIGLAGLATRNPWEIEIPDAMRYLEEDAGGGIPLGSMPGELVKRGLMYGRLGHFTDVGDDGKARIMLYSPQSIINWKHTRNNAYMVVVTEEVETDTASTFAHDTTTEYRALLMTEGRFEVRRFIADGSEGVVEQEPPTMTFQEGRLPFVFQGSTGLKPDIDQIPLEGMVQKCLKYWQLSGDLYHDIHLSNQSTLFGAGFTENEIRIAGAGATILASDVNAKLSYVSTSGAGQANAIAMMDRALESAEKQSHRMTEKTSGVEAAATIRQKTATKMATLRTVEQYAVEALELDLKNVAILNGQSPEAVSVTSEFDYTDADVDHELLTVFATAAANHQIPLSMFYDRLRSANLTELDDEEIMKGIDEDYERAAGRDLGMIDVPADVTESPPDDSDDGDVV